MEVYLAHFTADLSLASGFSVSQAETVGRSKTAAWMHSTPWRCLSSLHGNAGRQLLEVDLPRSGFSVVFASYAVYAVSNKKREDIFWGRA